MTQGQTSSGGHGGAFWATDLAKVVRDTGARDGGLSDEEAARRLKRDGPNQVGEVRRYRGLRLLVKQFTSPIILILSGATVLSMVVGDVTDGVIIFLIIAASGLLGFWQERSAGHAVDALQARVQVRTDVCRAGRVVSIPTPYPPPRSWSAIWSCCTPVTWCRPTAGSPSRAACR